MAKRIDTEADILIIGGGSARCMAALRVKELRPDARCVEICPLDNLRMDEDGFPFVKYDQCWSCEACELECPEKAIKVIVPYLLR